MPKTIRFTVTGNGDDPKGNPLPKLRMTQRQGWKPEVQRYVRYLETVRGAFLKSPDLTRADVDALTRTMASKGSKKLIPKAMTQRKAWLRVDLTWSSRVHGDPENVLGAIADAIFEDDKNLAVCADFTEELGECGQAVVTIELP